VDHTAGVDSSRTTFATADGKLVCEDCRVATSFFARLRGLAGRAGLAAGAGMLFPGTRSVHTHFMRFPIDVVFLDDDNRVVSVVSRLRPWRAAASRSARSVLELPAGACQRLGLVEGDVLVEVR
jgi:uncharacterized membrane protein (UPF0127 family)